MAKTGRSARTAGGEGSRPKPVRAAKKVLPPRGKFVDDDEGRLFDDYARKQRNIPPPQRVAEVVSRLLTKRGYTNVQAKSELESVWQAAAGPTIAKHTRPGSISRGTWEILVRNSSLIQELSFQQTQILRAVQQAVPQHKIAKLKFRVGPIE